MVGRPSKRTPEREARLLEALRAGNTRNAACHYAGITRETLGQWSSRFSDFSDAVQKAEADAEVRHVANIARAAQEGTWQASAWWLERRRPDEFGRRDRVQVQAESEMTIRIVHEDQPIIIERAHELSNGRANG